MPGVSFLWLRHDRETTKVTAGSGLSAASGGMGLGLGARRSGLSPPLPTVPQNQKKEKIRFCISPRLPRLPPPCSVRPYQKNQCLISNMHAFVPSEDGLAKRSPARISPANPRFRRTSPNHRHRGWRVPWGSGRLLGVLAYPGRVSPKMPEACPRQPPPRSCDPSRAGTAGPDDAPPKPLSEVSQRSPRT